MYFIPWISSIKNGNDYVLVVVDRFSKMEILASYKKTVTIKDTNLFLYHVRFIVGFQIPLFMIGIVVSQVSSSPSFGP
jgi:hypothetical protein